MVVAAQLSRGCAGRRGRSVGDRRRPAAVGAVAQAVVDAHGVRVGRRAGVGAGHRVLEILTAPVGGALPGGAHGARTGGIGHEALLFLCCAQGVP